MKDKEDWELRGGDNPPAPQDAGEPRLEGGAPETAPPATPPTAEAEGNGPVHEKTDELLEAARRRGRGVFERQKEAAVEELHSVADVMRDAAHRFEEREDPGVAEYVQKAAGYVDRVSSTLRERNPEELMRDLEEAMRKRPALALGVSSVIGFALGRFLRAGTQRIAHEKSNDGADQT